MIKNLLEVNSLVDTDGEKILARVCPHCGSIFMKDKACERVECGSCKKFFNFCCGSKRDPVVKHSNIYHRPSCRFYDKEWG